MSNLINCLHTDEILDHHTGSYVCIHCGLVKDVFFQPIIYKNHKVYNEYTDLVSNLIEKFNLSDNYIQSVKNKLSNDNIKSVVSEVYKNVNKKHTRLLLKNITNLTGLKSREIKSENIHVVNLEDIVNKYTSMMNIPFKDVTLFKSIISSFENTGYQPLSIIGGLLYMYFVKRCQKKSMKYIANILGINLISIQRFVKKNNVLSKEF